MTQHITRWQRRKVLPAGRKGAICIDVVLLVLASLRINAASVTGVIIANEAGGSSAVSGAAVDQIQTKNRSGPTDLGSVGAAQNQTEQTRRKLEESQNQSLICCKTSG